MAARQPPTNKPTRREKPSSPRKKSVRRGESPAARTARAQRILAELHRLYPDADCALRHDSALHLLVATILSAQCTDDRVNKVTPALFEKYRKAADLAGARPADLEKLIQSTGFFRNKARNLIGAGKVISERFGGSVPDTMEDLLEVPGVARKTANVVLGTWYKKNVGVVVDTHIGRLSHRLGLTWRSRDDKDAVRIEQDLMEVFPQSEWTFLGHALIWHGRKVCSARKPACEKCSLSKSCPSAFRCEPGTAKKAASLAAKRRSR